MNQHGGARWCTALHGTARHSSSTGPLNNSHKSLDTATEGEYLQKQGMNKELKSDKISVTGCVGFYGGREAFSAAWECMGGGGGVKASLTMFQPHVGTRQHWHGSHGTARRDTAFSRGPNLTSREAPHPERTGTSALREPISGQGLPKNVSGKRIRSTDVRARKKEGTAPVAHGVHPPLVFGVRGYLLGLDKEDVHRLIECNTVKLNALKGWREWVGPRSYDELRAGKTHPKFSESRSQGGRRFGALGAPECTQRGHKVPEFNRHRKWWSSVTQISASQALRTTKFRGWGLAPNLGWPGDGLKAN
ncbi:hypothetical protein B0H16DRAFT_1474790 [Mycena metata]|uniref:Uncharacterized protein n=1 Tax=Mycena metata TaxID=1033252 RepID=A0AAD7HFY9_9AGAR|nr:hypothetical protein B0H16DRAFT_1474790 [Mycena metata]